MRRLIILGLFPVCILAAFAQDQPVPQDAQLTVVVKDEQGNSVAGARVICAPTNHSTIPDPLPEPLQGVSDAEGRCQFRPLPRMTHYIIARTDTHGAWGRADFPDPPTTTVELTLKRGLSRTITVEDPQGKPIPGVALIYGQGLLVARTDDKGQASLPNLGTRDGNEIVFLKVGLGFVREHYWMSSGRTKIVMSPGALIEGTVKDPEGQPIAGAVLSAYPFEARSDEQGRFRLGWFSLEQPRVSFSAQVHRGDVYLYTQEEVEAKPGTNAVDVVLRPPDTAKAQQEAAAVEGKVVMKDTGEPVRATLFYTYNSSSDGWYSPSWRATEPDGTFRLEGLMGDSRIYLAVEPDRKTLYGTDGVVPVELKKGETVKDVVLTVDEGFAISGRVVDAEGKGVDRAEIIYEPHPDFFRPSRTRGTGTFIVSNLHMPGEPYTLIIGVPGQGEPIRHKVEPVGKGEIAQTEIRLEAPVPEGMLRGLVVDVQGKPVTGAQVVVSAENNTQIGTTDDDGRFELTYRLREAARATLRVQVERQVYLGRSQTSVGPLVEVVSGGEQSLEPGKTVEAERVVVKLTPQRHMTGRITDPAGAAVNAQITALSDDGNESNYANEGMFVLRKLPEPPFVIEVTAQGHRARILEPGRDFPADAEEIEVTLHKGPFAENRSIFSQVTGREESVEVLESLPAAKTIQERCRSTYPAMAGNKVQQVPID